VFGVVSHLKRLILSKQHGFVPISAKLLHVAHRVLTTLRKPVSIVERSLHTINIKLQVFAHVPVLNEHMQRESEQQAPALIVDKPLSTTSAKSGYIAPENASITLSVVQIEKLKDRIPVYNLEIADAHEFFANGILVHNCLDALRYAVAWLTEPRETAQVIYPLQQIGRY